MRNQRKNNPILFSTVRPELLAMNTNQHRNLTQREINANKVRVDREEFRTPIRIKTAKAHYKRSENYGKKPMIISNKLD